MAIIIVMKYSIPNEDFPAITSPQGTSSLFDNYLMMANYTVGVTPDNTNTRDFVYDFVLKAPQLQVHSIFLYSVVFPYDDKKLCFYPAAEKHSASLLCK